MAEQNIFEMTDTDYLRDLAERLRSIPVMYGVDGGDIDRLEGVASSMLVEPTCNRCIEKDARLDQHRAEIRRLTGGQMADFRYWEGRWRDEHAENLKLRKDVQCLQSLRVLDARKKAVTNDLIGGE